MVIKTKKTNNSEGILYQEIKERLKDQFESINIIDTKAGIILGFAGAILAALLNSNWFESLELHFLVLILSPICLTTVFAFGAFFVRNYKKDPEPSKLIDQYQEKSFEETRGQLIRNFEDCFNTNKEKIMKKKFFLNLSIVSLALIVIIISIILIWRK